MENQITLKQAIEMSKSSDLMTYIKGNFFIAVITFENLGMSSEEARIEAQKCVNNGIKNLKQKIN